MPVTVAAILLVLLALSDFPWLFDFLFLTLFPVGDVESVELLGHHRSVCAQLPFRSTGGSPGARGRTESCYRSNGGSGSPHHSVGSASRLPACFSICRSTFFARKVS